MLTFHSAGLLLKNEGEFNDTKVSCMNLLQKTRAVNQSIINEFTQSAQVGCEQVSHASGLNLKKSILKPLKLGDGRFSVPNGVWRKLRESGCYETQELRKQVRFFAGFMGIEVSVIFHKVPSWFKNTNSIVQGAA
jgi:hypothetical protein